MPDVLIDNPILNSPFEEPTRHFRFEENGITDEIVAGRRLAGYFVPIPPPKKKGKQLVLETQWTQDRFKESEFVNRVRARVKAWRDGDRLGITNTTRRLIDYWTSPERERRLFFCQIEAVETAIYLTEVADKQGDAWILNSLRDANEACNPGLFRVAFKMATGTGKTVVMGMIIAWHVLNKLANPQDARFSDSFLIVAPGITIRDRLRVLLPNDPDTYYRKLDLVPGDLFGRLGQARIVVTNFHAFLMREKLRAPKLTKDVVLPRREVFTETPAEMVRRVCRDFGNKANLVVINDEAHHCYRRNPDAAKERLARDERREATRREQEARVWLSGLEAIQEKLGIRAIYDLSATPFFLKGSGYKEGTIFPWVVSDFSLIDAIEAGVVKIPRVPVADDAMLGRLPTYRHLWPLIKEDLPKKGRGTKAETGPPVIPKELQGALESLYGNYEKAYRRWEANTEVRSRGLTPPVFIVVCNNTNVSKIVFDYIAGHARTDSDGDPVLDANGHPVLVPGELPIFSNVVNNRWTDRPNTILVDSEQLESGEAMSVEFKKIAADEIEEWKAEYRARFPGRDAEQLRDEDLLREVMNTVGKPGKLGENVKCVVSVSMLTEGWDANTVTHILGVRAFGTQLLCEQVVGRGLRRMSYAANDDGKFEPEYAEIYGVPFSFIPTSGSSAETQPGPETTRVRALPERSDREITFPRLEGYRYEVGDEPLELRFTDESRMEISTRDLPSKTELEGILGTGTVHTLESLRGRREQEIRFELARDILERHFPGKPWRFPELLRIVRRWQDECLVLKDDVVPQYLHFEQLRYRAMEKIAISILAPEPGRSVLRALLAPYDSVGSTSHVEFDTTRPTWSTRADRCHVSHVVLDSDWEAKLAQSLEEMGEVVSYVKNARLGFTIPYTSGGRQHGYFPDYIVCLDDGHGPDDLLKLVIEVTGEKDADKEAKVATARDLWVPAVNGEGAFGRWAFHEIRDPWNAKKEIRGLLASLARKAA